MGCMQFTGCMSVERAGWDRTSRDQSYSTYHQDVKQTWPWLTNRDDDQCGLVPSVKRVCGCPSGWLLVASVSTDSAASLFDRPAGLRRVRESVTIPIRYGGTGLCWAVNHNNTFIIKNKITPINKSSITHTKKKKEKNTNHLHFSHSLTNKHNIKQFNQITTLHDTQHQIIQSTLKLYLS